MISGTNRMYIAWGVVAALIGSICIHNHNKNERLRQEEKAHITFYESVKKLKSEFDASIASIDGLKLGASPYHHEQLLNSLHEIENSLTATAEKGKDTESNLHTLTAEELPENDLRRWNGLKKDLETANSDIDRSQHRAEELYKAYTEEWRKQATADNSADAGNTDNKEGGETLNHADLRSRLQHEKKEAEDLHTRLVTKAKAADTERKKVTKGKRAYYAYKHDSDDMTTYAENLKNDGIRRLDEYITAMDSEKSKFITPTGEINHDSDEMKAIDGSLQRILAAKPFPLPAVTPVLYVAPPPPPFEPDVTIIATGDLSSALLEPLVLNWLRNQAGTGIDGNRLTWVDGDEEKLRPFETASRELEAQVPAAIQGKESGKLRIRITTTKQPESVFSLLQNGSEKADLVLTGRKMKEAELRRWLPVGKTLAEMDTENKGRAYRTRVCADAMVFFRGQELPLKTIKAGDLYTHTKVFMANNPALSEAAEIFGLCATGADKEDANANVDELSAQNPNAIVLGTWHKDGRTRAATISVQDGPALNYVVGLDKTSLANADSRYTANDDGYAPTEDTINSGRYAYSHDIFFFRSATDSAATPAVKSLMSYAGNIEDADLTRLIRNCGFVPPIATGTTEKTEHSRLTNADLPIDILLSKLPEEYGYTKGVNTWVYGKRIAIPLYYEVGSTTSIEIDPDSDYYTTHGNALNAIPRDRKACLVCVGHADPRWKGQLSSDKDSWLGNLALSEKRADIILDTKFRPMFQSADNLSYVSFGCSWARPACDIALEQGADVQERELARSRRVEIFVVLPFDTKKE